MSQSIHTGGIICIQEIGLGIGLLLIGHSHRVRRYTMDGRHNERRHRIISFNHGNGLGLRSSKVPSCDAYGTAGRIADVLGAVAHPRDSTFYHNDSNATLRSSARTPTSLFESNPHIVLIEGGVIGRLPHSNTFTNGTSTENPELMSPD
ncbi:hypothetical protein BDR22DRAFT_887531 [Usnea florida]